MVKERQHGPVRWQGKVSWLSMYAPEYAFPRFPQLRNRRHRLPPGQLVGSDPDHDGPSPVLNHGCLRILSASQHDQELFYAIRWL